MPEIKPFLKWLAAIVAFAVLAPIFIEGANSPTSWADSPPDRIAPLPLIERVYASTRRTSPVPLTSVGKVVTRWLDKNSDGIQTSSEISYVVKGELSGISYRCSGTSYYIGGLSAGSQKLFRVAVAAWVQAGATVSVAPTLAVSDVDVRSSKLDLDGRALPKNYLAVTYPTESVILLNAARILTVSTAVHEIGHTLGLAHSDGHDIMSTRTYPGPKGIIQVGVRERMLNLRSLCPEPVLVTNVTLPVSNVTVQTTNPTVEPTTTADHSVNYTPTPAPTVNEDLNGNLLPIKGKVTTIHGTNAPWIGSRYGRDFAPNDNDPSLFDNHTGYQPEEAQKVFDHARNQGYNMIRTWVFEEGEGINWDSNGYATGIKPEMFVNMKDYLDRAERSNIAVYLTLHSHADVYYATSGFCNDPSRTETCRTKRADFLTNPAARVAMIRNVTVAFINNPTIRNHPALWGVDVVNEFNVEDNNNGTSSPGRTVLWQQFIKETVPLMRSTAPNLQITASMVWWTGSTDCSPTNCRLHEQLVTLAEWVQMQGVTFVDGHRYVTNASHPFVKRPVSITIPILIGEYAMHDSTYITGPKWWDYTGPDLDAARQVEASGLLQFVPRMRAIGYAGGLHWAYHGNATRTSQTQELDPSGNIRTETTPSGGLLPAGEAMRQLALR